MDDDTSSTPSETPGNRLTETTCFGAGCTPTTTTYTYDSANRLETRDGQAMYTWDDNGNLLGDGVSAYVYDKANRLIGVTQGAATYAFDYNGLGDRLRQTVNGTPTNYTLDLAGGLTQVLADGTNTYLYGSARIGEQQQCGWAYHLSDALGSVRQLADSTGALALAQSYEPYGETLSNAGSGASIFQFAGEERDGYGLDLLAEPVPGHLVEPSGGTPIPSSAPWAEPCCRKSITDRSLKLPRQSEIRLEPPCFQADFENSRPS